MINNYTIRDKFQKFLKVDNLISDFVVLHVTVILLFSLWALVLKYLWAGSLHFTCSQVVPFFF